MVKYHVYILKSINVQKTYVGMTQNIERRFKEHNAGQTSSTKAFTPWIILFAESFETRGEARNKEKYLKSAAGRRWIKHHFFS